MKSSTQRVREVVRRARPYAMLVIGALVVSFSIVTEDVPPAAAFVLLATGLLIVVWGTVLHYERTQPVMPERSLRRVGAAWRWIRPYVTFITGGLFLYVGLYQWFSTSDENMAHDFPMSLTFTLWAVGLLIIGRANTLYRERPKPGAGSK